MTTVEQELTAPYAPISNIALLLDQIRSSGPGLVEPVTVSTLKDIGIPEGNTPRGTMTLKHLGIIDGDGKLTEEYYRLRKASAEDFRAILADLVRRAYQPIFAQVDPATAPITEITRAFAGYNPERQRSRIISLFIYLCDVAGIRRGQAPLQDMFSYAAIDAVKPVAVQPAERPKVQEREEPMKPVDDVHRVERPRSQEPEYERLLFLERRFRELDVRVMSMLRQTGEMPPYFNLLAPLLRDLPREGRWTKRKRDRWLEAFAAQIDYVVEIEEAEVQPRQA